MRGIGRFGSGMLVVALAVVAAGCSGDDDDAGASATSTAAAGAPATSAATGATVADSAPDSAPDSVPTFTGDPNSPFCGVATEMDAVEKDPENPFDPTFYETMISTMTPLYDELATTAPSDIAIDIAIEREAFSALSGALAAVDYQFLDVELSAIPDSPEIDHAKDRVDAYLEQVCGIERDDDDDSGPPATEGTVRELLEQQFVDGGATAEQATCMVDFMASAPSGSDMEIGIGVMAACGYTQPLVDAGFTADEAECAVDYLSTNEITGSEVEMGIALVAACGITAPLVDAGFTEDEAQCVVETLAAQPDVDTSDSTALGLAVINTCNITRFFTERGFSEEQATCMLEQLSGVTDLDDERAVIAGLIEVCVGVTPPTTTG